MEIAGNIYGDWEVIDRDKDRNWNCKCATCGMTKSIHEYSLTNKPPKCNHISKSEDLIDKQFGEWKVIKKVSNTKVLCECSCGKQKEVNKYTLINGKSTNCGHLKNKDRIIDLTGKQFNDLKVIKYLGDQYWECECSCGNICKKHRNHLIDGRAHDCGHSRINRRNTGFIDITNQKFGILTAKEYKGNNLWLCECKCGNTIMETGPNLRHKGIVSCGCINRSIDREEITSFSNKFKLINNRLPYRSEMADHFSIGIRQIYYFLSTRNAYDYVIQEYRSKQEKEICELFNSKDIRIGDRKIISPYELDIYIPDKKLAIEFNGNYWHSEMYKDKLYHQHKTFECAKKGIQLIHIFEYEWDNEKIKEKIKNILMDKINAKVIIESEYTEFYEIEDKESYEFLNKYHIQGYANANIKIGCKYQNDIIGLLTIKNIGGSDYSIVRTCFKNGIQVINGYENMFRYFIDKYKPRTVNMFLDIDKFKGGIYTKLGFKPQGFTEPNYVWYNSNKKDIKTTINNENDTEYHKIYDSGDLKLLWEANRCSVEANSQ